VSEQTGSRTTNRRADRNKQKVTERSCVQSAKKKTRLPKSKPQRTACPTACFTLQRVWRACRERFHTNVAEKQDKAAPEAINREKKRKEMKARLSNPDERALRSRTGRRSRSPEIGRSATSARSSQAPRGW
jgi:hypothetical protein